MTTVHFVKRRPLSVFVIAFITAFFVCLSLTCTAQNITNGLVGHYTFCDCTAADNSGNNRHGTIVGNPQCIRGIRDFGLLLNQVQGANGCGQPGGQYVQLPALGPIWAQGFTVCAWVRFDEIKNFERIIDFGNSYGENNGLNVWFGREGNSNNLTLESWIDANAGQARTVGRLVAPNAITNGNIEYYCATISGDTMRIYVNGVLRAQKRGNPILNVTRNFNYIGRSLWCFNDPDFKGFMDEVRIYNRPLNDQEIQTLYQITNVNNFTAQTSCSSKQAVFSVQGAVAIDSIRWDFGDPASGALNTSTTTTATHLFTDTGSFDVRLVVYKRCLNDTVLKRIRIYQLNNFLGPDFSICPGSSKPLKATMRNATYLWNNGTTLDSLVVTQPGLYWVQVVVDSCVLRDSVNVTSSRRIETQSVSICQGQSFLGYTASGTYIDTIPLANGCDSIYTLHLTVLPKSIITEQKQICAGQTYTLPWGTIVNTAGTYRDTVRYKDTGCDSLIRHVTLLVQATSVQTTNASFCAGQPYVLPWGVTANGSGTYADTLRYSTGCDSLVRRVVLTAQTVNRMSATATLCEGHSYTLPWGNVVNIAGVYADTLRYFSGCDSAIRTVTVFVVKPTYDSLQKSICPGQTITLPSGVVVSAPGFYRDTLRSRAGSCDSMITFLTLIPGEPPAITISKSNDISCGLGIAHLKATGGVHYSWSPAATLDNALIANPVASPAATTVYRVRVTNADGCSAEDSIEVQAKFNTSVQGFHVPSAFTPNNDGKNDCFGVQHWGSVKSFQLRVYNRWGDLVFETKDISKCWNGVRQNTPQGSSVFVYQITAETNCGRVYKKGTVTLVR